VGKFKHIFEEMGGQAAAHFAYIVAADKVFGEYARSA
jgi:hypothetical protein